MKTLTTSITSEDDLKIRLEALEDEVFVLRAKVAKLEEELASKEEAENDGASSSFEDKADWYPNHGHGD